MLLLNQQMRFSTSFPLFSSLVLYFKRKSCVTREHWESSRSWSAANLLALTKRSSSCRKGWNWFFQFSHGYLIISNLLKFKCATIFWKVSNYLSVIKVVNTIFGKLISRNHKRWIENFLFFRNRHVFWTKWCRTHKVCTITKSMKIYWKKKEVTVLLS